MQKWKGKGSWYTGMDARGSLLPLTPLKPRVNRGLGAREAPLGVRGGPSAPLPNETPVCLLPPAPFPVPRDGTTHTMQGGSGISSACTARGGRWGPASFIPGTGSRRSGLPHGPVGDGGRAEPPPAPHRDWAEKAGGPRVPPHITPSHGWERAVPGGAEVEEAAGAQGGAAQAAERAERGCHGSGGGGGRRRGATAGGEGHPAGSGDAPLHTARRPYIGRRVPPLLSSRPAGANRRGERRGGER